MTKAIERKQLLNAELQYFIENKDKISVVVYALVKGDDTPKKMDINPEAQGGLISLFLTKLQSTVIDNEDLSILNLSSSDSRSKVIYYYDLDIPDELNAMNKVVETDDHEFFKVDEDGIDNIKVLLIEIGDHNKQIVLYKTMAPVNIFSKKHFFLKQSHSKFEKINDDFFRISDNFQLIRTEKGIFIFELDVIEKSFGFHDVIKKEAALGIAAIRNKDILSNISELENLVSDVKYARKLTRVAKSSPVLSSNISNDKIIAFCQAYPALKNRIRFNPEKTKIMLDTKVSKDLFIKILMDDFLTSQLTDFYYESVAKDEVETH
ncbi:MAG: anti-phage protein KwaB [Aeromonas sp.]|uniref:anti-phage protein KwaB n=1 Tax=Aeromonas sp. TaxID=647 RepID=UPI003F34827D